MRKGRPAGQTEQTRGEPKGRPVGTDGTEATMSRTVRGGDGNRRDEEGHLDRLSEAHLVREDAVHPVVVEAHEELEAVDLVRPELPCPHHARLLDLLLDAVDEPVVLLLALDDPRRRLRVAVVGRRKDVLELLARDRGVAPVGVRAPVLLDPHAQVQDDVVRALEQRLEPRVLGLLREAQVLLEVLVLEGRDAGLGLPLDPPVLLSVPTDDAVAPLVPPLQRRC